MQIMLNDFLVIPSHSTFRSFLYETMWINKRGKDPIKG